MIFKQQNTITIEAQSTYIDMETIIGRTGIEREDKPYK